MLSLAHARCRSRALVIRAVLLGLSIVPLACGENRVAAPRVPGKIVITSGNAQLGSPGQPLARPIVLVVRTAVGDPVPGVRVTWFADDGGRLDPASSVSDANGIVAATWTLGPVLRHRGRAIAEGYAEAEFRASIDINAELPLNVLLPLPLKTYDGSGQAVHPDFVATGPAWRHRSQYLFITPYPNGNATFENPSIFESELPVEWTVPDGVMNPIVLPNEGYFSDPDALYVAERNEIWLYFRQVTGENIISLTTTTNGVTWTAPVIVARAPNHALISPSVVRRASNEWLMWSVNGNVGCTGASTAVELRRSTNGVDWSKPQTVDLTQPGFSPWHIDVQWIASRGEFWALYNVKTSGSCTTSAVYLATSKDGVQWTTFPSPVIARGAIDELRDVVYRSTFSYDEASDVITFWYSGARVDALIFQWRSAVQRRRRADVFATITAPAAAVSAGYQVALPALTNFP